MLSLPTSHGDMFMAFRISLTGSIPITRSDWGVPWRKAARMSKLSRDQPLLAMAWSSIIRDVRWSVGLSRGISSILGSKYPKTTRRAFALWVRWFCVDIFWGFLGLFGSWDSPTGSNGFQVKIHRHRKIWSSGIWFRKTLLNVPVWIQFCTSASLALSNSAFSEAVSSDSLISVLCFLALVARRVQASGSVACHGWN